MGGRYDLTDFEWLMIEPLLPNKPRGVPRVDDRRVLNGVSGVAFGGWHRGAICWSVMALHDLLQSLQPLAKASVWDRIMDAVSEAYDGDIQMIDSSVVRVHQHAASYLG